MNPITNAAITLITNQVNAGNPISVGEAMAQLGITPSAEGAIQFDTDDQYAVAAAFDYLSVENFDGPGLIDVVPMAGLAGDIVFAAA